MKASELAKQLLNGVENGRDWEVIGVAEVVWRMPSVDERESGAEPSITLGWQENKRRGERASLRGSKPVWVDTTVSASVAEDIHGPRYAVDWIWHDDVIGLLYPQKAVDDMGARANRAESALLELSRQIEKSVTELARAKWDQS
jgi:hypothetical protein